MVAWGVKMEIFDRLFRKKREQVQPKLSERQKPNPEELHDKVRELLDPLSILEWDEYIEETAKMFINAEEKGIDTLYNCLNDVFILRARNMDLLLKVAYKVILHTKDAHLISILEKILYDGRNLVEGYPTPPTWMPDLETDIAVEGKYGWSDGIWIGVAHAIAEFLLELLPQLPTGLQAEHADRLLQATNYHIERWGSVLERATYKKAVEKDINYWKSLKAKIPNLREKSV